MRSHRSCLNWTLRIYPAPGFERCDDPKPPQPVILRQRPKPLLLARLEAPFSLELAKLVDALCRILGQVLAFDGPVVERFQLSNAPVCRDDASAFRLGRFALCVDDRHGSLDPICVDEALDVVLLHVFCDEVAEWLAVDDGVLLEKSIPLRA